MTLILESFAIFSGFVVLFGLGLDLIFTVIGID